jgi:nucleolar protein 4
LRSNDRIDPDTKLGRSKGYGFVEFSNHADALASLRWMNNNPKAFSVAQKDGPSSENRQRPIVEFAIENKMVLKRRMAKGKAMNEKNDKLSKKRKSEDNEENDEKPQKRVKEESRKRKAVDEEGSNEKSKKKNLISSSVKSVNQEKKVPSSDKKDDSMKKQKEKSKKPKEKKSSQKSQLFIEKPIISSGDIKRWTS